MTAYGLFLERNRHTCRNCPVKCSNVQPTRLGPIVVEGGFMVNNTGLSASKLNDQAVCVERGVGVFGGSFLYPMLEKLIKGEDSNLKLSIVGKIRDSGTGWSGLLDVADWSLVNFMLDLGGEENIFGRRTTEIAELGRRHRLDGLSITDIKFCSDIE